MKKFIFPSVAALLMTGIVVVGALYFFRSKDEDLNIDVATLNIVGNPYSSLYTKYCIPRNPYSSVIDHINNPYSSVYYKYIPRQYNPYSSIYSSYRNKLHSYGSLYSKYDLYNYSNLTEFYSNPYSSTYGKYSYYDYGLNDSYSSLFTNYCERINPYSSLYIKYEKPNKDLQTAIKVIKDIDADYAKPNFSLKDNFYLDYADPSLRVDLIITLEKAEAGKFVLSPTSQVTPPAGSALVISPDGKTIRINGNVAFINSIIDGLLFVPHKYQDSKIIMQADSNADRIPDKTAFINIISDDLIVVQDTIDFGNTNIKGGSIKETVITNTSTQLDIAVENITLSNTINYEILDRQESCQPGTILKPNGASYCKVIVQFQPDSVSNTVLENIEINFDKTADKKITLSGTGYIHRGSGSQKRTSSRSSSSSSNTTTVKISESGSTTTPVPTATQAQNENVAECDTPFNDVECDNKLKKYIEDLKMKGVVKGNSSGNFSPALNVTRAELATFIVNGFTLPQDYSGFETRFWDVNISRTHHNNILILAKLEIVLGYSDGSFKPDQMVKREEATKFIYKAMEFKRVAVNPNRKSTFFDVPTTNPFYSYISYLTTESVDEEKIMSGTVNSQNKKVFKPADFMTREQMAKVISNSTEKL